MLIQQIFNLFFTMQGKLSRATFLAKYVIINEIPSQNIKSPQDPLHIFYSIFFKVEENMLINNISPGFVPYLILSPSNLCLNSSLRWKLNNFLTKYHICPFNSTQTKLTVWLGVCLLYTVRKNQLSMWLSFLDILEFRRRRGLDSVGGGEGQET